MTKITTDQIKAAYEVASAVYDDKLSASDGVQRLHLEHELNRGSARDLIDNYRWLLLGREFHRTLSLEAVDYFLRQIDAERGAVSLDNAIAAVYAHLDYYTKLEKGGRQPSLRKLTDKWAAKRAALGDLGAMETRFQREVTQVQADSSAARQARIEGAPKIPAKVKVVTEIYIRNPDVVAEVLARSKGICELCTKAAPFVRRSDHTPYLEVHHRLRLADGGEDTVENAIALCPNCHRELHFGSEK